MKQNFESSLGREGSKSEEIKQSDVSRYWKRYNFKFNPPKPNSPAEDRLKKVCADYAKFILDPNLSGAVGSDGVRRQLHDQLSLMTLGEHRADIGIATAEEIADFACLVTTGMKADQAFEEFNRYKK
jgi:hypothetical protein